MKIAYVNTWGGFELNNNPSTCFFSRVLREVSPNLEIDVGYTSGKNYDLVISMYTPFMRNPSYADLTRINERKLCFTGESYNLLSTTPGADGYIGFDNEESMVGNYMYLRFPLYAAYHMNNLHRYNCSTFDELRAKFAKEKMVKMSAVVSNPSNNLRNSVIKTLVENGLCDSGGKVYNNIGNAIDDKLNFISRYSIGLAFENIPKRSYITEKIYEVFAVGSIPFYYGAEDIQEEFNPDSFLLLNTVGDESALIASIHDAVSALRDKSRIDRMLSVDPITGFRSERYIRNGKEILKNFIMNIVESK